MKADIWQQPGRKIMQKPGFCRQLLDRPKLKYLGYTVSFGRSRSATLASKSAPIHGEN
ncbi:hypothetical protein QUB60_02950 [Microcoleus sp. A2-C5]|uniref:hypothetical protein n=1 Tax=Microcoleaceae TaxID=1892252 RepID=UPI002237A46C|nr:hypothetical protein [Lyngbya sp. CCAP 1446/10]MCW6050091.1 hypothetical protein [Lyngbya sp. CCAP 1446/10]